MLIVGCDFQTRFQQIAMLDSTSGEIIERRLGHETGEARAFYAAHLWDRHPRSLFCFCFRLNCSRSVLAAGNLSRLFRTASRLYSEVKLIQVFAMGR